MNSRRLAPRRAVLATRRNVPSRRWRLAEGFLPLFDRPRRPDTTDGLGELWPQTYAMFFAGASSLSTYVALSSLSHRCRRVRSRRLVVCAEACHANVQI
jgi:hypothetical protein